MMIPNSAADLGRKDQREQIISQECIKPITFYINSAEKD